MVLPEQEKAIIKKKFEALVNDVELIVFTQELECQFCKEVRELVLDIGTLSPKIKTKVYDYVLNGDQDIKYNIKKIPAIAIIGKSNRHIRFYGVPSGYEINVLIDDIIDVSKGTTSLPENIKQLLAEIKKPVHLQVFVTPTCPYCPKAAKIAHQFAIENENIRADVIEMIEFPHLVQRYSVMGTPHIVINEDTSLVGLQPPQVLIEHIHLALSRGFNPMYS